MHRTKQEIAALPKLKVYKVDEDGTPLTYSYEPTEDEKPKESKSIEWSV